jgi:hypothetical protein
MTLCGVSGSESKSAENRIGGRLFGLPTDPILDLFQAFSGLMNVVAFGDIDKSFEQLLEAEAPIQVRRCGCIDDTASRRASGRSHFFNPSHPIAFPCGLRAALDSYSVAG